MTSVTADGQGLPTSYQSRLILLESSDHESDEDELFDSSGDQRQHTAHQSRLQPPPAQQTGRRTPSLFSNEIWLEDNTGTKPELRDFRLGTRMVHSGRYEVYECTITLKSGNEVRVLKRFSAFETLAHDLEHSISRALLHNIPPLPSKTTLGKYRPKFLEKRRKRLETWLIAVMLHPDIGGSDAVKRWVTE